MCKNYYSANSKKRCRGVFLKVDIELVHKHDIAYKGVSELGCRGSRKNDNVGTTFEGSKGCGVR
jgi:hypothetical protein